LVSPTTHRFEGILLATSFVVVRIVRDGQRRPPDLRQLASAYGDNPRSFPNPHRASAGRAPTAILLICREPFNQNGSGEIDCATEKRRLSAAFEAKIRKSLAPNASFQQPVRELRMHYQPIG
jgi:hypothetical protein